LLAFSARAVAAADAFELFCPKAVAFEALDVFWAKAVALDALD